ncbi:MAG: tRNA (N6-isopentenyl adenosine(37)-C2)-methylthiotransferase MiaB [Candidatus Rokubacteria bacterium 13_1_40CM_69_27]|nr:MAG: tRNA (N6-isopentenyl adenosine(37)-C2)-methylthiotransferase MiaB [Candidatus Rokubacteria bacterium 13_1_40CM_69_27]OLE37043.1 MAG: tRNA (N6-isopentenyl adenosine(37)-C2)-methylthiotransferase MiaB [Candidatus Rokubacteria bacterium 13_1_20CM_2_70_7]
MAKLHLITYGCQMNEYDSERVAGLLKAHAYELTDSETEADLILVNTCAIREKAEEKVFSKLGQLRALKARRPELIVGVMGCMAQLHQGEIQRRAAGVDLVFGSPAIAKVGELVERVKREGRPVLETGEAPLVKITATPAGTSHLKSYVTVMEGCEKRCTFCVVPVTRGRQRSHSPESILAEVRGLAAEGCREVTLLGQTVEMYGRDLAPLTDLAALMERVEAIEGIERIRFTTSNPFNFTSRLIHAIRDIPKVCEYVHLPLQSGSNRVLERMNRGYTRQRYLELIAELREAVPEVALSTDLIVGFPGETEDDFEATLDMVERVGYDNVFVFRYSPRPGTPAATMPEQIPLEVKAQRNSRLLEVAARAAAERSRRLQDRVVDVLVDGPSRKNTRELQGRTRCNRVVNFEADGRAAVGDIVAIQITDVLPHSLRGALASLPEETVCLSR